MPLHNSESVKLAFDHIRSVWTLSAGGLAAGLGLFGYIAKEAQFSSGVNTLFALAALVPVILFMISIWNGVTAQKILINEVSKSEKTPIHELKPTLVLLNKLCRWTFFGGCAFVALMALFFVLSSEFRRQNDGHLTISLKNATLVTKDTRATRLDTLEVTIPVSALDAMNAGKSVELRDVTLKETTVGR